MKLAIISLGGPSSKAIAAAAKRYFERVDLLSIKEFQVHVTNKSVCVMHDTQAIEHYDCIYVRGSYKYALLKRAITRALKGDLYLPIDPETFTVAHDKFLTLLELQRHGIRIPKTFYAATTELAKKILQKDVKYPVIIKLPEGTHGKGVMVSDSLKSSLTILDTLEAFKQPFIIQEFVKTRKTTDIRAIVVGDRVVAAYKRQAKKGDIRANIHAGGARHPYQLTNQQRDLALRSAKAIGAEICGVDILNAKTPAVVEINLSPGVSAVKEVTGVNVPKEIAKFLRDQTKAFIKAKESRMHPFKLFLKKIFTG